MRCDLPRGSVLHKRFDLTDKKEDRGRCASGPFMLVCLCGPGPLYLSACLFVQLGYPLPSLSSSLIRGNNRNCINEISMLRHCLAVH